MPTWGWIIVGVVAGLGLLWLTVTMWCALILGARADEEMERAWQEYLSEHNSGDPSTPPSEE